MLYYTNWMHILQEALVVRVSDEVEAWSFVPGTKNYPHKPWSAQEAGQWIQERAHVSQLRQ